jgi:catechol 2,3-dioxygenase-like lactoylglutathione lyase family enzyme
MFRSSKAFSGFSTDDVEAAKRFYGETLGIKVTEENGLLTLHLDDGARPTLVYPKEDHVPATYTILNFPVADIDEAVDALVAKGVEFEKYPGSPQDEKGVMRGKANDMGPDIAWFKDPAGNILSVLVVD